MRCIDFFECCVNCEPHDPPSGTPFGWVWWRSDRKQKIENERGYLCRGHIEEIVEEGGSAVFKKRAKARKPSRRRINAKTAPTLSESQQEKLQKGLAHATT